VELASSSADPEEVKKVEEDIRQEKKVSRREARARVQKKEKKKEQAEEKHEGGDWTHKFVPDTREFLNAQLRHYPSRGQHVWMKKWISDFAKQI